MSLRDLVKPPKPPSRRGRVVSLASTEEDGARWSDAARARASARMKALNADPEFKANASARMKALHADPEFKAKVSKAASARMKALHADPEFKARMKALHADPEFKERRIAAVRASFAKRRAAK